MFEFLFLKTNAAVSVCLIVKDFVFNIFSILSLCFFAVALSPLGPSGSYVNHAT